MSSPLQSERVSQERVPLFFADPDGLFAYDIAEIISDEFLPVILTKMPEQIKSSKVITISYRSKIPKIPENAFAIMYYVQSESDTSVILLHGLLKEAQRRDVPFCVIVPRRNFHNVSVEKVLEYTKGKVFLYGDVVDDPEFVNPASQIIARVKEHNELGVTSQGLQSIFPVSKEHVVSSIIRYSLVDPDEVRVAAIVPVGEMYELSLARIIQKMLPNLSLRFLKAKKVIAQDQVLRSDTVILSEADDALRAAIEKELRVTHARKARILKKEKHNSVSRLFIYVCLCAAAFLSISLFLTLGMAFFGQRLLYRSLNSAKSLSFAEAEKQAEFARSSFLISDTSLAMLLPLDMFFPDLNPLRNLSQQVQTGRRASEILVDVSSGAEVYKQMVTGSSAVSKDELSRATQKIKAGLLAVSQLSAETQLPEAYKKKFLENKKSIDLFLSVADLLPQILGYDKEKKYLVLFQNNNELRPGGGFIGSYAVIALRNGKLGEVEIQDVYDADGQLKGHVEPPSALKKYLGANHWYLRDSNFSPDFPENAANAALFLSLETGQRADGVVALDTAVLEGVMRVIGPVQLPGVEKSVNAENVIALTQNEVESGFFPGSMQKKDFLNDLYVAVQKKVEEKSLLKTELLGVVSTGFEQKHILVAFADEGLALPFALQGLSSTLQSFKNERGVEDFIGVNEANVGLNKVNAYIKRRLFYDVELSESTVVTKISLMLENTSKQGDAYGGDYDLYVRFLLPEDSSPEEITIDGVKQVVLAPLLEDESAARGAVSGNVLEVERVDLKGKSTYGFFVKVPQGKQKEIVVLYSRPNALRNALGKYTLTLFKQPGTGADPFRFTVRFPEGYVPLSKPVSLRKSGMGYSMLGYLTGDLEVAISYGKK